MHKLKRSQTPPSCLATYRHGLNNWGDVTPEDKSEIWQMLEPMQGKRCAYCEISIEPPQKRHIEHFEQKGRLPQKTFVWSNLFGSCNYDDRCGRYKDKQHYNSQDLIKPDIDDPEYYLVFAPNGSVSPRSNLSPSDHHKAQETIRVFRLDDGVLQQIRYRETCGYVQDAEFFAEMLNDYPDDIQIELQEKINETSSLPFATAIKHILTNQAT